MRLGAVLAGGMSSRFGSDKATALWRDVPMIDHAAALLRDFAEDVVIVGGERDGCAAIPDLPAPGLGPLGGICGALAHAKLHGFETVVTVPCDTPDLPPEALAALIEAGAPSCLEALPVAGLWLARDLGGLISHFASGGRRSVQGWARTCDATLVQVPVTWTNVNRPEDLDQSG
jgi:molybdopterin-guanine dinucleotide biosynthesis protein A